MKKDNWIPIIFILTFIISFIFACLSNLASNMNVLFNCIVLIIVIGIGIIFDMIGVAVLSSEESTFHAKASKKIKGSKECIWLIKNANKTSSICNDVIGDICGIVSGTITASLVVHLRNNQIAAVLLTAVVSALTVGGKAIGKKIAINNAESIVFKVGKILGNLNIKSNNKK